MTLSVNIVCSDPQHPVMSWLEEWCETQAHRCNARIVATLEDLDESGDFLFLISCQDIVPCRVRQRFTHTLVIHASDLPEGRGWSPLIWQILERRGAVVVSLLEASEKVDSGRIWAKRKFEIQPHETLVEINRKLFECELELMTFAVEQHAHVRPQEQDESAASYYPRRSPNDSRLDPHCTIAEQFDLLRAADINRYPCFMDYRGHRYRLVLEKIEPTSDGGNV